MEQNSRVTHIELVVDLSTDNSILLLRSFICRRGHPYRINSDNRKNFAQVKGI